MDITSWIVGQGADLQGADLRWAGLRGADLRGADLRGADLEEATLREADLREADLIGAFLRRADLRGADLEWVDLRGADLQGAFLEDAALDGADLCGADLEGARAIVRVGPIGHRGRYAYIWGSASRVMVSCGCKCLPAMDFLHECAQRRGYGPEIAELLLDECEKFRTMQIADAVASMEG